MKIDPSIFKAYDIRGLVPEQLTADAAAVIARATAQYCKKIHENPAARLKMAVGRDNRISSPEFFERVVGALQGEGVDVVSLDMCSTPFFSFAVQCQELDGGIMVTASHNPPQFNGFKLIGPRGEIGAGSGMEEINSACQNMAPVPQIPLKKFEKVDLLDAYIQKNLELVPVDDVVKKLSIVVDTGNGVSVIMIKAFFDAISTPITPLFFELDGTFPNHLPNPLVEKNLELLKKEVLARGADVGIALDTDGDRIVFMDERGKPVRADLVTALLAQGLLKDHVGEKILYDLRSSKAVPEAIAAAGGTALMSRVGHTLIKLQMRKERALFAGELSGHYYFRDIGFVEGTLLVIAAVLNLIVRSEKKLSELVAPLQTYFPTGEINFEISDKAGALKRLEAHYADAPSLFHLDGVTIEYADWWCNVRPSNTENTLRLNLEARSAALRDEKLKEVEGILKERYTENPVST